MLRRSVAVLALVTLAAAAPAAAKQGHLTRLEVSPPPGSAEPGEPWTATMRALDERGRLVRDDVGLAPVVTIRDGSGNERLFAAEPTAPGKWRAQVVFPRSGRWTYTVSAGPAGPIEFFDPVTVGASDTGGFAASAWVVAAAAGTIALLLALLLARRRRPAPPLAAAERLG